ncbi:M10 family metallopeptidase C-terminal domain-containing protein [Shinella kummerowiae]|uniref:M10 family metallopeptidase C-terminal domain-containing protein n=1 Tax=Shinella kummerowiae TaxID=417745 RepID=UPI0021B57C83|nr:M10 family metallopeptidase C-terminal domain-containing protein [Shinella kummerowiae]MCT7667063.1 M10 family metallopeptidase C-terminal domain-containing protein [Shinella kummerowiae]
MSRIVTGTQLNDIVYGTDLNETYMALGGDDKLVVSGGNDSMYGGEGWDTLSYFHYTGSVTVVLNGEGKGVAKGSLGDVKSLYSIEAVILSNSNDIARGDAGANTFFGREGDDRFIYSAGEDTYYGDGGWDTLDYFDYKGNASITLNGAAKGSAKGSLGDIQHLYSIEAVILGAGNDVLRGDAGANVVWGNGGNDNINGGAGADRLSGGAGADKLTGGLGADQFIFSSVSDSTLSTSGRDFIVDFNRSQGDKIDLSAIDANTTVAGNQAFTFVGEKAFSHKAGELRYTNANGDTYLHGDANGDGTIDFSVRLDTTIEFAKGDFIL